MKFKAKDAAGNITEKSVKVYLDVEAEVDKDFTAARDLYYRMLPALSLLEGGGKYAQFVKAGCALSGHPVGPPRPPLRPATAEEEARIRDVLGP